MIKLFFLLMPPIILADWIDDPELLLPSKPEKIELKKVEPEQKSDILKEEKELPLTKSPVYEEKGKQVVNPKPSSQKSSASSDSKYLDSQKPILWKSDGQTVYSRDGASVDLSENVVITQADLRLRADRASVYLENEDADNSVKRVEISGNVKVSKFSKIPAEAITAKGRTAFFLNKERLVTLEGNARLWRGGHLIKGNKITYQLDTGTVTVDQASGVVKPELRKKSE